MKRPRFDTKFFLLISALVLFVLILNYLRIYVLESSIQRYTMLNDYIAKSKKSQNDDKHILFWSTYFEERFWGMPEETSGKDYLKSIRCPRTNCVFTHKKNLLKHPHDYDAIVFHGAENWSLMDLPKTRSPQQVYVFASKESPAEIKHNLDLDHDFYNLTMTYRLDSDIQWFYGITIDLSSDAIIAPAVNVKWREPDNEFHDNEILQLVKSKQKSVAWFVSHCNTFSGRDELVRKLQGLIDVDVYGKCGKLSCPKSSNECSEMLNTTYKFYLSFENTLCIDYLTEKLYNAIQHYVIPIIYSGAEISHFLPPRSYINADDFETIEELANYLEFLSQNVNEYLKYFWWKKHYKIIRIDHIELCELCMKLNEPNFAAKRQTYVSIKDWFYNDSCKKPNIKF